MNNWLKEKKQDFFLKTFLFLTLPVVSFFYSFFRVNTKSSYIIFSLMSILFGLAFSVPSGKSNRELDIDGQFYRGKFESYINVTSYEFTQKTMDYLGFDSKTKDFYFDTLAYFVSRITENYHILFMFSAIVFSYFCLKSFRFLTSEANYRFTLSTLVLVLLFLQNSLFNINGMRFWTASWIAIYCIFQIFVSKNRKYYFLAALTPFFHGSYFIFLIVLLIAKIFKRFEKTWVYLFIASFVFSNLSLIIIELFSSNFQNYLPPSIINLINAYTAEDYISAYNDTSNLSYTLIFKFILPIYLAVIVLVFFLNSKAIKNNEKTKEIYLFLLVWLTVFNFLTFIPALGGRYIVTAYPIIAYIWLVNIQKTKFDIIILFLPFALLMQLYRQINYYLMVLEPSFFFSNPFILLYKYLS